MAVLAGDIGGTSTRLALAQCAAGRCRVLREREFESRAYADLAAVLREFLKREPTGAVEAACFGVAGPVRETASGEVVKVTNLPWEIEAGRLAREFSIPRVRLINDFQAIGYAIEALDAKDCVVLQTGEPVVRGPRALIGAGTGLGQGILVWQSDHYEAIATEGGHVDFAPTNELQLELARFLMRQYGQVSYETILSGAGIARIYRFLRERGAVQESADVAHAIEHDDPAAVITHAALERSDALCAQVLDLFVRIYGAQAGNLALAAGATGGVYIAGGIAPRIIARLTDGAFMEAFRSKGEMSRYVAAMPVQVIMNTQVGLLGAALAASRLSGVPSG